MFTADLVKFDTRLVSRFIEKGEITVEEYEKALSDLEDSSDNLVVVDPTFGDGPGIDTTSANA